MSLAENVKKWLSNSTSTQEAVEEDPEAWRGKRPDAWTPYDRAMRTIANGERRSKSEATPSNCDVMERTGDGRPVGRCHFHLEDFTCPRHGNLNLIPSRKELP